MPGECLLLSTLPAFPFKVSPRLGDFRGRETKMINRDALYAHRRAKRDALDAQLAVLDADYKAKRDALYAHRRAKLAVLDAQLAALDADYKAKRDALDAHRRAKCDALDAHRRAKCDALDAQLAADHRAKCDALDADYEAKLAVLDAEILVYIKSNMPDCAWNGKTLVFPCDELPGGNGATK